MSERELFMAALEIDDPAARAKYLDESCAGNDTLRRRIDELLGAVEHGEAFMAGPAAGLTATTDAGGQAIDEELGTSIGPYQLQQRLGEGGMGVVFLAEQLEPLRRQVAIKIVKAGHRSAHALHRFEAERQALALMDHPNIAKVFDAGTTLPSTPSASGERGGGRPYFVMELVHGLSITKYCDQEQLTPRQRLELFIPVCQAVQHAHQKGIIHRDLKPSNVLIAVYDGKPVPKVIDFGVAKAIGPPFGDQTPVTEVGTFIGTLEYMAPEQAEFNNLDIDTRADIYSLGVLLYELLTGTPPFSSKQLRSAAFSEMLRMIREVEPPRLGTKLSSSDELPSIAAVRKLEPKQLTKMVHGELDWIVMKCLEKERHRRYETANALALDLDRYLADEPVLAGPPSAGYRFRKFARRNRGPVLAACLVLLALMGGIVGTTLGLIEARRQRDKAEAAVAAETKAKANAETRETETRAILDFVQNKIFVAAQPKGYPGGLGRDVTLRSAIIAGVPFVDKSFTREPLIEARLRTTLGISFWYLGELSMAAEQYEKANLLFTEHRGPYHADTLKSRNNLAIMYADLGRNAEALKLREETLALQKVHLGPDHLDTLKSMHNLANSYFDLGRHNEALSLREETLALQRAKFGLNHQETFASMVNLANSYQAVGRLTDALKLREESLTLMKATLGPDHPDTLTNLTGVASNYDVLGRLAEALKLREEILALQQIKLGPDHPATLWSMNSLAISYDKLGRHAEALALREEILKRRKAHPNFGPDHPATIASIDNLALSYVALGRLDEALMLHEQALALFQAKLGHDHPDTLLSMSFLAKCYAAQGRNADALKLREETLAMRRIKLGPEHPDTLTSMNHLARSYADNGRNADALKLHEETLALRQAKLGPDHPNTLMSMRDVAASLVRLNRGAEAVPIIDDCFKWAAGKVVDPELIPSAIEIRLRHFEKATSVAGCRTTAEMWEQLGRTDVDSLYTAARTRAVAAAVIRATDKSAEGAKQADLEAERAMDWLRRAAAAGYKNIDSLKNSKDLDTLRTRDDFQRLQAALEKK